MSINVRYDLLSQEFDSQYPITLQDKNVPPQQYQQTIRGASLLLKQNLKPFVVFGRVYVATIMVCFFFLMFGMIAFILGMVFGIRTLAPFVVAPIYFACILLYAIIIIIMAVVFAIRRKSTYTSTKQQMEQYFETENQKFYYAKGVQFRFSFDVAQVLGYKRNYLNFTPHLEILFANGPIHSYQSFSTVQPSLQPTFVQPPSQTVYYQHLQPPATFSNSYQPLVGQK